MSPRAGELLLDVIQPMLIAVVPQVVRTTGAEDSDELVQDGMCMAAQAIETLENQGKDLMPRSVAYYTIQRLKSGRRYVASRRAASHLIYFSYAIGDRLPVRSQAQHAGRVLMKEETVEIVLLFLKIRDLVIEPARLRLIWAAWFRV